MEQTSQRETLTAEERRKKKEKLKERVTFMVDKAVAQSTRAIYDRNWRYWEEYCREMQERTMGGDPVDFACFMVARADQFKSVAVATNAIAAVKERHMAAGLPSPTDDVRVHRAFKGIQKQYSRPAKQAEPMTREAMTILMRTQLQSVPGRSNADKLRAWRTVFRLRLCHAGLLRFDEALRLRRKDLVFGKNATGREYLKLAIRSSKTDQEGKGEAKYIPEAEDKSICPVEMAKKYLKSLKNDPECPLQQEIQVVNQSGLAKYTGMNIDRKQADKDRQWLLEQAGFERNAFTEHSGKRGAAVALMNEGVSKDELRRAGGWKTDTMPEHYAKNSVERSTKIAKLIG